MRFGKLESGNMTRKGVFPLLDRPTPLLDVVFGNPERKLYGILAETPEEIRQLRRGIVIGFVTALAISTMLPRAAKIVGRMVMS